MSSRIKQVKRCVSNSDDDTKVQKRVNPGDKIEAKISSKGHTLSVTRIEP